jgi:CRP-like cAMP-binding protein
MTNFTAAAPLSVYTEDGKYLRSLPSDYYATKTYTDKLIDFIDANRGDGKPFFAYLAHQAPHDPYHLPREWRSRHVGEYDKGWDAVRQERLKRQIDLGILPKGTDLAERMWFLPDPIVLAPVARAILGKKMELYAGMVENLDFHTGRLVLAALREFNRVEGKTVIIVTHDSSLAKRSHRTALITDGEIVNEYVARALPTLNNDQLLAATHRIKPRLYEPGAMILTEGRDNDKFYIVSKGTVDIFLPRPSQSDVTILQLGPGKYFGEGAFFHSGKANASVRASESTPVEVLAISYDQLNELLSQSEVTREALHQAADFHQQENIQFRSRQEQAGSSTREA